MTDAEFRMTWDMITACARLAQCVDLESVRALIETANRAESIGPFIDPTAYLKGRDNLTDQKELAEAFCVFRKAIETVKERAENR